jgi:phage terminase small subunit
VRLIQDFSGLMALFCFKQSSMAIKKTNAEKELQGTLKPERKKTSKIATLKRIPKPSFELTAEAKRTFRQVVKIMIDEDVATALDVYAITNFAFWYHQLIEANNKIIATVKINFIFIGIVISAIVMLNSGLNNI